MKRLLTTLLVLTLVAVSSTAWAENDQAKKMQDATTVLNGFVSIPENAIPPALLNQAYGIAVIPGVLKAGFVVGGRYGEGVLSVRTADGTWSHPVFIDIAGASLGWQIGASSTDLILVFKNRRGVNQIINGQVTLGADASVAAGPVGRSASAATNLQLDAEIYSYSRSRGLFAGVALQGAVLTIDADANWTYYGRRVASRQILKNSNRKSLPPSGQRFVYTLDQYMPPLNTSFGAIPYGAGGNGQNASATQSSQAAGQRTTEGQGYGPVAGGQQPSAGSSGQSSGQSQVYGSVTSNQTRQSGTNTGSTGAGQTSYGPVYNSGATRSGSNY